MVDQLTLQSAGSTNVNYIYYIYTVNTAIKSFMTHFGHRVVSVN